MKLLTAATLIVASSTAFARPAPLVSIPTHDAFFNSIAAHCGKAFELRSAQASNCREPD